MAKQDTSFEDKLKSLSNKYGKGTLIKASSDTFVAVKEFTSTGSLTLDLSIGKPGIPKGGHLTVILGKESSSKTTLSTHIIAEEQKKGGKCAFLDVEGTFSPSYASAVGVDLDNLYLVDKDKMIEALKIKDRKAIAGEEWLELVSDLLVTDAFDIIVLDSVAELCPMSELQKGIAGGGQIARMGAMLSPAMRNINANLINSKCGLIFLNQYRITPGAYGNPFIEVGGESIKYYTTLKIELSKSLDKDAGGVYGIIVKSKITKSKISAPFKEASYYVEFGRGIVRDYEIYDLAVNYGIIIKTGGWYKMPNIEDKIQGEENVLQFMKDNPEYTLEHLETPVLNQIKNPTQENETEQEPES